MAEIHGHFGSGTYFCTYKNDNLNDDSIEGGQFIKIRDGLYRVDMDFYKNLYRVKSEKQGDVLYSLLKELNSFYNNINPYDKNNTNFNLSSKYELIRANSSSLGLKCPSYMKLIRLAQEHGDSESRKSFSTLFMEMNGFNGVNVNGIPKYDNTTHGSVIYDVSKVDGDIEQATPQNLFFADGPSSTSIVAADDGDTAQALQGHKKSFLWMSSLSDMDDKKALRYAKNYAYVGNVIPYMYWENKSDLFKQRYLRILYNTAMSNRSFTDTLIFELRDDHSFMDFVASNAPYYVNLANYNDSLLVRFFNELPSNVSWDASDEEQLEEDKQKWATLLSYLKRPLNDYEEHFQEVNQLA